MLIVYAVFICNAINHSHCDFNSSDLFFSVFLGHLRTVTRGRQETCVRGKSIGLGLRTGMMTKIYQLLTLGKIFKISVQEFSHLYYWDNTSYGR